MDVKTRTLMILAIAIVALVGGAIAVLMKNDIVSIIYFVCLVASLIALYVVHTKTSHYVCSKCDHIFVVNFINDLTCPTTSEGKYLKCPKCKKRGFFKEMS